MSAARIRFSVPVIGRRRIIIDLPEDAPSATATVDVTFPAGHRESTLASLYGGLKDIPLERLPQNDDLDIPRKHL